MITYMQISVRLGGLTARAAKNTLMGGMLLVSGGIPDMGASAAGRG